MVLACGEMNLTNFSKWVFKVLGCCLLPQGYFLLSSPLVCRGTVSSSEPKAAYDLYDKSVFMYNIPKNGTLIIYIYEKELNISLILLLN